MCANLDVEPDTGNSTNPNLDTFVNEDYSDNLEHGSVSRSKFVSTRIWYNNSPYMLYGSLIDSIPASNLGHCPISGYSKEGLNAMKQVVYWIASWMVVMTLFWQQLQLCSVVRTALTLYFGRSSIDLLPLSVYSSIT